MDFFGGVNSVIYRMKMVQKIHPKSMRNSFQYSLRSRGGVQTTPLGHLRGRGLDRTTGAGGRATGHDTECDRPNRPPRPPPREPFRCRRPLAGKEGFLCRAPPLSGCPLARDPTRRESPGALAEQGPPQGGTHSEGLRLSYYITVSYY